MEVKSNSFDSIKNFFSIVILFCLFIYIWLNWSNLPEQIPGHYNASGVVDRWGNKSEIIILPIIAVILYIGITLVENLPQIWNTGVSVTDENRSRVYSVLKSMITTEKLLVIVIFAYLSVHQLSAKTLPTLFFPLFLVLMFGSVAFYIVKLYRVK